jgi:hypothetical protein
VRCADAIAVVLRDAERSLRASEIASEINRRSIYRRGDGRPLPPYQVASVAHGVPGLFRIVDGLISLGDERDLPASPQPSLSDTPVTAVLVGCVSRKERSARPARDLYRTELFRRRRAYAEASARPWYIVSALHGLLKPEQVVDPYDVRLSDLTWEERHALAAKVAEDLAREVGPLAGCVFEVHAGEEYARMIAIGLRPHGVAITAPLRGLRIGEQLAWYGEHAGTSIDSSSSATYSHDTDRLGRPPHGLALALTSAFNREELDLSLRADAPAPGWDGMPEVIVAKRLRLNGASDSDVRLLLTLTAAMDRARDADALWFAAERLFVAEPWTFSPAEVTRRSLTELADVLRAHRVSQRHGPDAAAWRVIAESLANHGLVRAVHRAIFDGVGDARELLDSLPAQSAGGTDRFPFLRGPKVGPMWVRMLAFPGGAELSSLEVVPVAVDVQVRKVTEYLGVTDTGGLDLELARPRIQAAWQEDVRLHGAEGPDPLGGKEAGVDPALWFWAKWGCTRCERAGRRLPIGEPCGICRFPDRV